MIGRCDVASVMMKSYCVLLLPRQVQLLLFLLCSCHMLLLLLNITVKTPVDDEISSSRSVERAVGVRVLAVNGVMSSLSGDGAAAEGATRDWAVGGRGRRLGASARNQSRYATSGSSESHRWRSATDRQSVFLVNSSSGETLPNKLGIKSDGLAPEQLQQLLKQSPANRRRATARNVQLHSEQQITHRHHNDASMPATDTSAKLKFAHDAVGRRRGRVRLPLLLVNQPLLCSPDADTNATVHSVILVMSAPYNQPQRDAIRKTWARRLMFASHDDTDVHLRLVFVVGVSDFLYSASDQLARVTKEAELYRDMVVGDFNDTYQNLTLKALFGLQWVSEHCNSTRFTVKTDDDTFINVNTLRQFLQRNRTESIIGSVITNGEVMREGLWEVDRAIYPQSNYPSYCSGVLYLLSTAIINDLLMNINAVALVTIEDAFITGILAQYSGYQCVNNEIFPHWHTVSNHRNNCRLLARDLIALHHVYYEKMYEIYDFLSHSSITGTNCSVS